MASILSAIFSTLLLLQVKASEIPLDKPWVDLAPPGLWKHVLRITPESPLPDLVWGANEMKGQFQFSKLGDQHYAFQNFDDDVGHRYFIVDFQSKKWSGLCSIGGGAEHTVRGHTIDFYFEYLQPTPSRHEA